MSACTGVDLTAFTNADMVIDMEFLEGGAPMTSLGTATLKFAISSANGRIHEEWTTADDIVFTALTATASLRVPAATVSATFPADVYRWDLQVRRSGAIDIMLKGSIEFKQGVGNV